MTFSLTSYDTSLDFLIVYVIDYCCTIYINRKLDQKHFVDSFSNNIFFRYFSYWLGWYFSGREGPIGSGRGRCMVAGYRAELPRSSHHISAMRPTQNHPVRRREDVRWVEQFPDKSLSHIFARVIEIKKRGSWKTTKREYIYIFIFHIYKYTYTGY